MSKKPELILKNLSKKKRLFNKYKDDILRMSNRLMEQLEEPIKVHINIVDCLESQSPIFNTSIDGNVQYQGHRSFVINILVSSLENVEKDDGLSLCAIIAHEFAHINDRLMFLNSELPFLRKIENKPRTYKEFLRNVGYDFWTEFYAYRFMFINYKEVRYSSFLELVKQYEYINKQKEEILPYLKESSKHENQLAEYCEMVITFVYLIARYLAGEFYGQKKYYEYSEITSSKPSFAYLDRLLDKTSKKLVPMLNDKMDKRKANAIMNLGYHFIETFYSKFNMDAAKKDGYYFFAVYDE